MPTRDICAAAEGYVQSEVLGGRLPVQSGAFNLFVDEGAHTRHMLYRLYFADANGHPLTLAGYKNVRPGPITKVWPETSTLYIRILSGHVPVDDGGESSRDGIVGSGVLHILPLDFAQQLTTFRVHGPTRMGELRPRRLRATVPGRAVASVRSGAAARQQGHARRQGRGRQHGRARPQGREAARTLMTDIRYVILSDLHFGAENSVLTALNERQASTAALASPRIRSGRARCSAA